MSKTSKVLLTLLTIYMVFSITVGALLLPKAIRLGKQADEVFDQVNTLVGRTVDTGEEDNVIIADEYTILPTTQISDAYKSGDTSNLSESDKETLDMASKVLQKIIKKDMTDYEKEEAVYLWLTTQMKNDTGLLTVIPETGNEVDTPHGVLKNRNAVCVGYVTTFRLFMQMMNIECKVIHSSDLIHSWDLVKLDDEWYHVDCYSDADGVRYGNFNMNDTIAQENHDWNHEFFPAATGYKYSYAAQHTVEIKNIYAIPAFVKKLLDKEASIGCCTFKEKIQPEDEAAAAAMVDVLTEYISDSGMFDERYLECTWSKTDKDEYLLTVRIEDYNEDDTIDIDDDLRARIEKKISDVFGEFDFDDFEEDESFEMDNDVEMTTDVVRN